MEEGADKEHLAQTGSIFPAAKPLQRFEVTLHQPEAFLFAADAQGAHQVPVGLAILLEGIGLQVPGSVLPAKICELSINDLHRLLA